MQKDKLTKYKEGLKKWFFGFWVKQRRFTFLVMWLVVLMWIQSLYSIPKESNPDIDFGIISITTVYQWVNPEDMDNLVTEKIEQEIKDIEWIKRISSTSSVWVSSVIIEFENDTDMTQALVDMKDSVDKVDLPSDAEDPIVTEISSNNELMFSVLLYGDADKYSPFYLKEKWRKIKANLEGKWMINSIDFDSSVDMDLWQSQWGWDSYYDIQVLVDKDKTESLWLSIFQISQSIRDWNKNQPLGNHEISNLSYDFRIEWELKDVPALEQIPIKTRNGFVFLWDISTIKKDLKSDSVKRLWSYELENKNYVSLLFNKKPGDNVFTSAKSTKELLKKELEKSEYDWLEYKFSMDLSDMIQEDYNVLAKNWIQTLILVFIALLIFVWYKEAMIATITLPLAFCITFIVLKQLWLTLNFLTNFSFIITFGIAIDTTIVVIEWAHEKMRQWFKPINAILLAVREYSKPLIAGTATTVFVFIPLLSLPGIMGKFLAYIPITIFATLIAALFISLTINSAIYFKLSKPRKYFESDIWDPDYMTEENRALLEEDRFKKIEKQKHELSRREKILDKISFWYGEKLWIIMKTPKSRLRTIVIAFWAWVLSMILIAPQLWFTLFPNNDNGFMSASVTSKRGTTTEHMEQYVNWLDDILSDIPEMKVYYISVNGNNIDIQIELLNPTIREKQKMASVFEIEKYLEKEFDYLRSEWLKVEVAAQSDGPPSEKPIGLKLIADTNDKFNTLIEVSEEFEEYLSNIPWTKNVGKSSKDSPWQFVYNLDKSKLAILWISPNDLMMDLFATTNGIGAWTLKWKYDNNDIEVIYEWYEDGITPTDINNLTINTSAWPIRFGNVADYSFDSAISSISRLDNKITITVNADTEAGITPDKIQAQFIEFAENYEYPDGISFDKWGENEENADLIQAMMVAFVVSLLFIFGILVLQFNSYTQPAIIMFSVLMGLLWANIWLLVTWQPYSMMFGIWFIALTWIVVNDAIVFIDRVNRNQRRWMDKMYALKEAGRARLQPILLTTITTVVWLSSIVSDGMWKPLAVTIMFGIFFGSAATLFTIPSIFHDKHKIIHMIKRVIISLILFVGIPLWWLVLLLILWYLLDIKLMSYSWFMPVFGLLVLWYAVWYAIKWINDIHTTWQTIIQKKTGIKITDRQWKLLSKKKAMVRYLVPLAIWLVPVVLWLILKIITWSSAAMSSTIGLLYLVIIIANVYSIWMSTENQTWHDKKLWTYVQEINKEE